MSAHTTPISTPPAQRAAQARVATRSAAGRGARRGGQRGACDLHGCVWLPTARAALRARGVAPRALYCRPEGSVTTPSFLAFSSRNFWPSGVDAAAPVADAKHSTASSASAAAERAMAKDGARNRARAGGARPTPATCALDDDVAIAVLRSPLRAACRRCLLPRGARALPTSRAGACARRAAALGARTGTATGACRAAATTRTGLTGRMRRARWRRASWRTSRCCRPQSRRRRTAGCRWRSVPKTSWPPTGAASCPPSSSSWAPGACALRGGASGAAAR